jgi:hypothetical protein
MYSVTGKALNLFDLFANNSYYPMVHYHQALSTPRVNIIARADRKERHTEGTSPCKLVEKIKNPHFEI